MNHSKKVLGSILIGTLISTQALAADTLTITVKTDEKKAAAIGFTVEGRSSGSLGNMHLGKGPQNKMYFFGYRENNLLGKDIKCGSVVLTKNTIVNLVRHKENCELEFIE